MLTERRLSLRTTEDLIARLHKVIERSGEKQNVFLERAIKREVERREKGEGND